MGVPITTEEFGNLLSGFQRSWFKFETQRAYALTDERVPVQRFLRDGELLPPDQFQWWREWLDLMAEHARNGRVVQRVRVLDEPPTPYQRYLLAISHWHTEAGERIGYITRSRAQQIGVIDRHDWSLFDNAKVVTTSFTPAGGMTGRRLITGPSLVDPYRRLRDLLLQHATPARDIAAA